MLKIVKSVVDAVTLNIYKSPFEKTPLEHAAECILYITRGDECSSMEYIDKYNNFYDISISQYSINNTPLVAACALYRKQTAFKLIKAGANVNIHNNLQQSPLQLSCIYDNNTDLITELIKHGADIEYKTPWGATALSNSYFYAQEENVIALVEAGAHIHADLCYSITMNKCIRDIYRKRIVLIINDDINNAIATSFRTTYAIGVVDIIAEFII